MCKYTWDRWECRDCGLEISTQLNTDIPVKKCSWATKRNLIPEDCREVRVIWKDHRSGRCNECYVLWRRRRAR